MKIHDNFSMLGLQLMPILKLYQVIPCSPFLGVDRSGESCFLAGVVFADSSGSVPATSELSVASGVSSSSAGAM